MPLINRLEQVILYVQDMDSQVRFYRDTLELPIRFPAGLDDYSDQMWVELDTGATTLVLHGGGEKRHGEDAPTLKFAVDDIEAARTTLIARSVPLSEIDNPGPGSFVANGVDPEGNRITIGMHR